MKRLSVDSHESLDDVSNTNAFCIHKFSYVKGINFENEEVWASKLGASTDLKMKKKCTYGEDSF